MTKDLALLVGPEQPHQTARLFGEDCPDKDPYQTPGTNGAPRPIHVNKRWISVG